MRSILLSFTNIEYTIELAEALSSLLNLVLMLPEKQIKRFKDVVNSRTKLLPFSQPRLRDPTNLLFVYKIVQQIKRLRPDVIHIQRGHPWLNFTLPFLRRHCIVLTIHDVILHSGDRESSVIPSFTHNVAINCADQIIVHGEKLRYEMIREYGTSSHKLNVLNRGVNSIYRRYVKYPVREEKYSILFFGRIWKYKGLRYLIEAEPRISQEIPGAKIVIAGKGEDFSAYQSLMINKEKFVVYNGHISNEMVAELFQKASVVVLPYTDASQSGVVPLAYAFKKPVIVTHVGSLPEVVDHAKTGYIVPPRDSKKLAEAVVDLLRDESKRIKMGENAYEKTKAELSWDGIASKTLEVYQKALSLRS